MSYVTRDLLSFSLSRGAGEEVTLLIKTYGESGDGSYISTTTPVLVMARVVDLQPNELQRLQDKGISMLRGVSVGIAKEYTQMPDQIVRADGTILKVMDFTISENGSVFLCDVPPLGSG